ncbi:MAG: hypothetical protein DRI36_03890, partial [Caldiserica bacterium]
MRDKIRSYLGNLFERWAKSLKEEKRRVRERKPFSIPTPLVIFLIYLLFLWFSIIELKGKPFLLILLSSTLFFIISGKILASFFPELKNEGNRVTFIGSVITLTFILIEIFKIYNLNSFIIVPVLGTILITILLSFGEGVFFSVFS